MARRMGATAAKVEAMEAEAVPDERGAQAIHRALTILEAFATVGPAATLAEISEHAGLTVPTAHRMLRALQSRGYVTHDPVTGQYSLGSSVLRLAQALFVRCDQDHLLALATPRLETLRELTGETVSLHVPVGASRACIAELVSPQEVRVAMGVGRVYPIYAGATGKALLSGMTDEAVDAALGDRETLVLPGSATVITVSRLKRELAAVRRDGYAMSDGAAVAGATAIAAPVFGPLGLVAAITIAGPSARWTRPAMLAVAPQLRAIVATIGEQLGGPAPSPASTAAPARR